ncbi:hypothetical protein E4U21_000236 [Claviceps maximensis]|nr:hypothetical protein E4U21_000236 [Claviceps maximensis]
MAGPRGWLSQTVGPKCSNLPKLPNPEKPHHGKSEAPRTPTSSPAFLFNSLRLPPKDIQLVGILTMFSRQVSRTVRAAAPQRAVTLRATPVRSFAATASSANSQPPIAVFGLDGTYASALYTAASKSSTLDTTAKALATLNTLVQKDTKLNDILQAPTLTPKDKSAVVAELAKHAGAGGETVKNFLATLADNNRLGLLQGVCVKFGEIMSASRGEVELKVTSAQPLDNKTLSRLETAITKSSYVGHGQKLKVISEVNPDIVGGLIVEVGDRTIDLSVSSRISKMNKLLNDAL